MILDIKIENKIEISSIKKIFDDIVKILWINVLKKEEHIFPNGWFTLFYVLAESHISAHYRIEDDFLAFDVYSCNILKNAEKDILSCFGKLWEIKNITQLNRSL